MGAWYSENDPRRAEQEAREADQNGSFDAVISRNGNEAVEKSTQTRKRTVVKK
jgi:hypothetical protein